MEPTTLVTFLLNSIPSSHSVQLLGSWDNFTTSYPMQKDRQRGHGHWVGCHFFQNIVCDGDPSQPVEFRTGGLKPGGTYWYYYKLNGDIEYHDPSRPHTSACPLLPGQTVNVLHLPLDQSLLSGTSPGEDDVEVDKLLTRDPDARYFKPVPPKKRKRIHSHEQTSTEPRQDLTQHQKDWRAKSTDRLQTALVDTVIHAFASQRPAKSKSLQQAREIRTAPATMPKQGTESDTTDWSLLSRMDSCRSSARRPYARRGPPTKDGMVSRTASTKSVSRTENPFEAFNQRHEHTSLSSTYPETAYTEDEEQGADFRPATWNGIAKTFEWADGLEQTLRPSSAPSDLSIPTEEGDVFAVDEDIPEQPILGRLSAIIEVDAETSFGPDGEMQPTEDSKAHDEGLDSPETNAEMKRGDSKKSLRGRSSAMFSRRASKRSSQRLSRSSSLTESTQSSLEHTASSSQVDDASVWTSVRTSTSSISAGWSSPPFTAAAAAASVKSVDGLARTRSRFNHGYFESDKQLGLAEKGLSFSDQTRILPAAIDSQETIKPMGIGKGSSDMYASETKNIRDEQEKTFTELTEHIELAFETGRFERRFSFNNNNNDDQSEPDPQFEATHSNPPNHSVNSADFYRSTIGEKLEETHGDLQVHLPEESILEELSYLGSLIA